MGRLYYLFFMYMGNFHRYSESCGWVGLGCCNLCSPTLVYPGMECWTVNLLFIKILDF